MDIHHQFQSNFECFDWSFLFTSSVALRNGLVQLFQRFSYSMWLPLLVIVGGRPEMFRVGQKSKRFSFPSSFFFTVSDR